MKKVLPIILLLLYTPAYGQPLFVADFSSGAAPDYNFDSVGGAVVDRDTDLWNINHFSTGGPDNGPYVELEQVAHVAPAAGNGYGGQFGYGFDGMTIGTNPTYGDIRYMRIKVRFPSDNNGLSLNWSDGTSTRMTVKWMITQNGNPDRFIPGYEINTSGGTPVKFLLAIDGGDGLEETGFVYALNQWHNVQMSWTFSSSSNVADGCMRMWINTDVFGSPTLESCGVVINPAANSNVVGVGYFPNMGLDPDGGVHKQQIGAFEYDDDFDATWNDGEGDPDPPGPPAGSGNGFGGMAIIKRM